MTILSLEPGKTIADNPSFLLMENLPPGHEWPTHLSHLDPFKQIVTSMLYLHPGKRPKISEVFFQIKSLIGDMSMHLFQNEYQ